jgi:hypothetical protein
VTRWYHDEWSNDHPALRRMHKALSQAAQDGPGGPEGPDVDSGSCDPEPAVAAPSRRERIAQLVGRIKSGDLSAVVDLRELLA